MQGLTEERKAELRALAAQRKQSSGGLTEERKAELRALAQARGATKEVSGGTKALEIPKGLARGAIAGAAEQVFSAAAKDYDEYASAYVSAQDFLGKKRAAESGAKVDAGPQRLATPETQTFKPSPEMIAQAEQYAATLPPEQRAAAMEQLSKPITTGRTGQGPSIPLRPVDPEEFKAALNERGVLRQHQEMLDMVNSARRLAGEPEVPEGEQVPRDEYINLLLKGKQQSNEIIPPTKGLEDSYWSKIPEAFGGAAPFAAEAAVASAVGGPMGFGRTFGSAAAAAGGYLSQWSSSYTSALDRTKDHGKAFESAVKAAPAGLLEALPIGDQMARAFGSVNRISKGGLWGRMQAAFWEGGENVTQDTLQTVYGDVVQDAVAKDGETRSLFENALRADEAIPSFLVGFVLSALTNGGGKLPTDIAEKYADQIPEQPTPEVTGTVELAGATERTPTGFKGATQGAPWQQTAPAQTPTMPAEAPASEPQELKHRDKEILGLVREKWSGLPYEVARAVSADVGGVVVGAPTRLDDVITGEQRSPDEFNTNAKQVYDSFSDVRGAIREKYGSTVRLWRAQGSGEHGQLADYALKAGRRKAVLNYATKEEASKYLTEGRELVYRDVPVDEIVAVQNPTERGLYEEFIVLHPDATEADRRNLGLVASQDAAGSTQAPSLASEVTPTPKAILEAPTQPSEAQAQEVAPQAPAEPESPVPLPSEAAEVPPEARPEVSQPEPNDTVGIAAVKVQEMAAKYGFQPPPAKEAETFKGWMEEAKAIYDSTPERVGSLIAEAEDKPRALEPKEYVLLGLAQTARANALDAAYDRYNLESTPENLEALQREQRLTEEFNDSVAKAKSASGTSLRSIAVLINRDFSLAGMLKRRLASEGGESNLLRQEGGAEKITKIREEVRKEYEVIAKAEKDLAVEQAKAESADRISQLEKQVEGLRKRLKSEAKGPKPPSRQQAIQKSQKRISELIKELSVVARQANVGAPLDPKVLKIALDLAVESIKVGAMSFQQWADTIRQHVKADDATLTKVWDDANKASRAERVDTLKSKVSEGRKPSSLRGDFLAIEEDIIRSNMEITSEAIVDEVFAVVKEAMPSITREDVMDIIANRDNFKALPDDAVKRKRMQVNSEVQTDRKLLDVARKQIPKMTGFERMPPSDSNRRKTQQLNENLKALHEEMRRLGIEPEREYNLKSARDAIKTRLRNSISDRKSELERGERNVKERRTVEDDEAMKELRAQLAEVETLYDEMFAPEIRVDQLNREIASIDKRLADGGRTEVEGVMQGPPASPEVAERERLLLEKKAELKAMRDADVARAEKSAEQALRRSIQRTEARLRGQEAKPSSKAKPDSPLLRAMRSELTSLKAELDALPSTQKAKEEALIAASIARKEKVLSDLDRSTIMQDLTGELTDRQKRGQRKPSAPEVKLISQIEQAKTRNLKSSAAIHWKRASNLRKGLMFAADLPDVIRSLRTAFDFSVVMVQLGSATLGHPIKASRSWIPTMLKAAKSEEFFQELDASIRNRPLAAVADKAGLQLTDIDGERSKREELAAAKLLEYIPGIGRHGIRGGNRAFVAYMNTVRAETFDSMYRAKPGIVSDDEAMRLARFVNVYSGRGDTESMDEAYTALKSIVNLGTSKSRIATTTANASAVVLWAPRLYLSRVQLIFSPLYYATPGKGKTNFVRKEVAKQIARWIAAEVAIISLVNLYKHMNDDDEISVETDPRSSDFMKIRVKEKRYDTFGGMGQFVVLLSRLASGEKKTLSGEVVDIRGENARYGQDGYDVAARFARGKLTPFASMLVDYLISGKNVVGDSRDIKNLYRDPPKFAGEVLANYVSPMLAISVYQSLRDEGFTKGAIDSILSAIGTSIQNYDN